MKNWLGVVIIIYQHLYRIIRSVYFCKMHFHLRLDLSSYTHVAIAIHTQVINRINSGVWASRREREERWSSIHMLHISEHSQDLRMARFGQSQYLQCCPLYYLVFEAPVWSRTNLGIGVELKMKIVSMSMTMITQFEFKFCFM